MNHSQVDPSTPVHFFIHIPKCGGNTFSDYLSRHFPIDRIYTAAKSTTTWERFRQEHNTAEKQSSDVSALVPLDQRFINDMKAHDLVAENHFSWRKVDLLRRHRPVVAYALFRDPKERVASHYLHFQRIPIETAHELVPESREQYQLAKQLSIADWCAKAWENPEIWPSVFNLQTRVLASSLINRDLYSKLDPEAFFGDAVGNLESIDFVADLPDLEEFMQLISVSHSWLPPGEPVSLNKGAPSASLAKTLAKEVPDDLVALDLRLLDLVRYRYRTWKKELLSAAAIRQWRQTQGFFNAIATPNGWELDFAQPLWGTNFHGREGDAPKIHRWLGPSRQSLLFLPVKRGSAARISLYILAMIAPEVLSDTRFQIDGVDVGPQFSIDDNCTVATFTLTAEQATDDTVALAIITPMTASERDRGIGTDTRQKSLALRRIRICIAT